MSDYLKLGLLGYPLSHVLSPILQSAALQFAGVKGEYRLFDVEPAVFDQEVKKMLAAGVKGFNITIPYKQHIYRMVNAYTSDASQVGAVNTVKVESDGKLTGHNTDVIGFKLAFTEAFDITSDQKTALIIGAGGGAKAVVVALAQLGYKNIKIRGRDPKKVRLFITEMESNVARATGNKDNAINLHEDDQKNLAQLSLVVNASPLGLKDEPAPQWLDELINKLNDQCLCFDLVYGKDGKKPMFTELALRRKLKAIDGLPMLIHQARYAFEFWTGVMVPPAVMYDALLQSQ